MARGNFPSAKQDQFVLRLPEGMRDKIREAAEANSRSMNAEIVARLEEHPTLAALPERLAIAISERGEMRRALAQSDEEMRAADRERAELSFKFNEAQNEIVALKEQLKEMKALREKLAYQEGLTASHEHTINVLLQHLLKHVEGAASLSLEKIMDDLQAGAPAKQKADPDKKP